jgi:hypothetical protein
LAERLREFTYFFYFAVTQDVIDDFMRDASRQFATLEAKHKMVVDECAGTIAFFAEDAKVECEEFFGVFDQLLAKVDDARRENEIMRRKEEEDRKKQERLAEEQARKVV